MNKRLFALLSVFVIASMALAACGTPAAVGTEAAPTEAMATHAPAAPFECTDAIGCVDIAPGDPIHLAWIQTVSGGTAFLGVTNNNGAELAIDDKGQLLGHDISFTGEDSLCNAEGGQAAGTKISADPTVIAIVGTTCSSEARAAMPLIFNAGMLMISSSNTNPDLTNPAHPDHYPGYFRTAHNDLFQGRVAATFAFNELHLTSAATIHDGSPYAKSLQQVFADTFTNLGGTITTQEAINVGDTDFKPVLTKIASGNPQMIYFPIFEPEGDLMASQKCDVSGLEDAVMMGADGLLTSGFPKAAGSCSLGMYFSGPYVAGSAMDEFLAKYQAKIGEGPSSGFGPHSYDAMNMIFAAIEKVAVVDADGTVHIPRQALRAAMYAITGFPGLTGNLDCDKNGDCATGEALAIFQINQAMIDGSEDLIASIPFWKPGQ